MNEREILKEKSSIIKENMIAEEIMTEDGPRFLIYWRDSHQNVLLQRELNDCEKIDQVERLSIGDNIFAVPINDDIVLDRNIILPSKAEEYGTEKQLVCDIQALLKKYVDLSPDDEKLIAYSILASWVQELTSVYSYLHPMGDTESGKSRMREITGRLYYHCLHSSATATAASLFRLVEKWQPCSFASDEDEYARRVSDTDQNLMLKALRAGTHWGASIFRCDEENKKPVQYRCGCPKIFSTREPIADTALASRCLRIQMEPTSRKDIRRALPKVFLTEAVSMQNKLLMYRLRKLSTMTEVDSIINNWEQRLLQKGVDGHLLEALIPLSLVTLPEDEDWFLTVAQNKAREVYRERSESWYGHVIRALLKAYLENRREFTPKQVADILNERLNPVKTIDARSVGKVITALKIKREKRSSANVVVIDNKQLLMLLRKYGFMMDDEVLAELEKLNLVGTIKQFMIAGVSGKTGETVENGEVPRNDEEGSGEIEYAEGITHETPDIPQTPALQGGAPQETPQIPQIPVSIAHVETKLIHQGSPACPECGHRAGSPNLLQLHKETAHGKPSSPDRTIAINTQALADHNNREVVVDKRVPTYARLPPVPKYPLKTEELKIIIVIKIITYLENRYDGWASIEELRELAIERGIEGFDALILEMGRQGIIVHNTDRSAIRRRGGQLSNEIDELKNNGGTWPKVPVSLQNQALPWELPEPQSTEAPKPPVQFSDKVKPMLAKWPGICAICHEKFDKDTSIIYEKGIGAAHQTCAGGVSKW